MYHELGSGGGKLKVGEVCMEERKERVEKKT